MSFYKEDEVFSLLYEAGCFLDGEEGETGQVWFTSTGAVIYFPKAQDGWYVAAVVDRIFADKWLPKPIGRPTVYNEKG